jgi:hypothetical protein
MRVADFALDFLDDVTFEGYTQGETWNGFACPYFSFEQAQGMGASRRSAWLDAGVPVFTGDVRVVKLSGLQRPGGLVSAEDDAGRKCFRADELE